jgi:hypothetical protein
MAYMFLWSIIERYAALRYHLGTKVGDDKIYKIEKENYYRKCLKKYIKEKRSIISLGKDGKLRKMYLDVDKINSPNYKALRYYFALRSNVVHRGKSVPNEFNTLRTSLCELYNIFNDVINNAFNE